MRRNIICVFAAALALCACSDDMTGGGTFPFGPDNPLNVSGTWQYEATIVKDDCGTLFCSECHDGRVKVGGCDSDPWDSSDSHDPWYECIQGKRTIKQDGENLLIWDHIINSAMGVELQGSVRVYSGDFLCGRKEANESGTSLLYTEDGTFHSNDRYESILSISSSRDKPTCKAVWSVTGRRID